MRKFLRSFVMMALMAVPFVTQAQSLVDYTVTTGSTTFTSIAATGTQLSFTTNDDGYATVDFPFNFGYGESVFTTGTKIACSANGFLYLGSSSTSGTTGGHTNAAYCAVTAIMQQDAHIGRYTDAGAYYLYDANAGTLTIEYYKLGTYSSPYGEYSFQYVFHSNGNIDFIYGSCSTGTTTTRTLATYLTDGPNSDRLYLTGAWATPTVSASYAARTNSPMPESGLMYTFTRPVITCPKPMTASVSDIAPTSATVVWTAGGEETSWSVYLDGVYKATVSAATYTFNGLTANTSYSFSVRAVCSSDDSSTLRTESFHTPCDDLTTLPYVQDFEAASTGSSTNANFVECMTRLNNGSQYFGIPYVSSTASYNHTDGGTKGLYWYNPTTNTYGDYQYVILPGIAPSTAATNTLWVKFWAKSSSTSYHPRFEVGVMTVPSDPASFTKVADVAVEGTDWVEYVTLLSPYTGSGKYVAIRALRPTSAWTAYVDDITLEEIPACLPIANLSSSTTVGAANLTWTPFPGSDAPAGYEVNYKENGAAGEGTIVATTEPTLLLTGLTAGTSYEVKVRATCGADGNSTWSDVLTVSTASLACTEIDYTNTDIVSLGTGTSTNYYIPVGNYYNYSYTQQLYLASELAGVNAITGVDFEYNATNAMTAKTDVVIYMANTTVSSLSSAFVPYSGAFVQVYSGSLNCEQGWNHFDFTTPFVYDGSSNVVLVIQDNSNGFDGTAYNFRTTSYTAGRSRYVQNDNNPYDIATVSGGSALSVRVNTKFTTANCTQYATCAAPVAEVANVDETEVTISWMPGYNETSWTVSYREEDATEWTVANANVTAMTYTFTGLTPATYYYFRVQPGCSTDTVYAATVSAGTLCSTVTLPYSIDFTRPVALNCWSAIANEANPIHLYTDSEERTLLGFSSYSSATDYNEYLISPSFTSTEPLKLTFGHYAYNLGDSIQVLYTTSDLTNLVAATDMMTTTEYRIDTVYLPAGTTRVVFHYYGDYSYYYFIDYINIEARPQNTVTLNVLNIEGTTESWGTVVNSGLTVYEGDSVFFTSTPGEYKRTAAWYAVADTTGVEPVAIDTNEFAIRVTTDTAVTVLFGYGQFRIAAAPNQPRMGEVVANPASANNMYDYLSEVTLTANAADGFMFKEWLNADDHSVFSTVNPLTLSAIQNYDLTARFVIDTFTIDFTAIVLYDDDTFEPLATAGTVTGAENGLVFGQVATITAEPAEHYEWSHWATSAENITSLTADQTLSFRMLSDTTFYPVFTPEHYTVTINGDPARATYTGAGEYAYGDTVTITVSAVDPNYSWMGWMEAGETLTTDTFYTFVIESNRAFFANIPGGLNTVTFTVNDMDMGSVTIDSVRLEDGTMVNYADSNLLTVTLNYGSVIYATAHPAPQYAQFNGWSHGTADLMDTVGAFDVVNDTVITANFGFETYNVTVNVYPDALCGNVVINPAAPEYGESVTLTATAAEHWVFDHWTDADDVTIGTENVYTSGLLFEDMVYNVYFVRDTHTVVALVEDETFGTTEVTNADAEVAANFVHGSAATLTFTEGYGYTFAAWVDENDNIVSTDNPYTIDEVVSDTTLTATVDPIAYTVTVVAAEPTRGSVSTTTPMVDYLGTANITATPNYGYVFENWTNEDGDEIELPLVITQDTTVVAHFGLDQFTVTGAPHADCVMMGTVDPTEQEVDYRTYATITATANYGYHFTKWIDAAGNELATTESIEIYVESDSAVYAMFDYDPMDVTVSVNDPLFGSAAVTNATAPYFFSQTITIEATPAEHYHFNAWMDANGNTVSTENPYTFILTEPVDYTAVFAIDTHTVTLVYNENAVTDIYGAGSYIYGSTVEIGLTEAYGFTFTGWDNGETVNPLTITLTGDTVIEALFSTNQYTVTAEVAAASAGMGTASGTNTVDYMSYVILMATPATGYDFVNWTNADGEVASTNTAFYVQATQDTTFYANFKPHAYTVTIASADENRGDVAWSAPTHLELQTDEALVSNGTTTNSYVPIFGTWTDAYQRTQFIYPASMLTDLNGGTISEMKFYAGTANKSWGAAMFNVKVMEVAYETFTSNAFADIATATQVYYGSLSTNANKEMVITFSTPYTYNGGNLLIEVGETTKGTYSGCSFYGVSTTNAGVGGYNSSAYSSVTASRSNRGFLPKVTFTYDHNVSVLDPVVGVTYDETDPEHIAYVEYQNSIAMQATAEYGYHFTNWTNSLDATTSTDNPMTVASVEADVDYTANFDKNQYTITAQVGGDMAGTVAGSATVDYLETVTLTATPNADHRLLRWVNADDEILGTDLTLTVTAERDSVITAVFGYEVYTMTVNTEDFEMGGVYVMNPNDVTPLETTVDEGTTTNSYVPVYGSYMDTYGMEVQAIYPADQISDIPVNSQINALTFYLSTPAAEAWTGTVEVKLAETANESFGSAAFEDVTSATTVYTGTLDATGSTMTITFDAPYTYNGGNLLYDLRCTAAGNWKSAYFYGIQSTNGAAYTSSGSYVYTQNFLPKVKFTYAPAPGTVPSMENSFVDVDYTTNVNVYATPADHYHFVGWMNEDGDTVTALGINATPTITVLGDSTLTALFDGDQMPMTYQVNNAIRGAVEGPAAGEFNTEVEFEAIAAHGYQFSSWEDGVEDNPRTVTVAGTDAENTYKAIFDYKTYNVDVTVENGTLADEFDNRNMYYGTQVTLTAVANEHYNNWKGWFDGDGNLVSAANPYTFFVLEDITLNGKFEIDSVDYTFASNDVTMGTVTSTIAAGRYAYETEVTLTATAADVDHHFVDWNDGETAAERTVVLTQDTDLVANFALNQYNIATNATNGTAVWAGYDYAYPTVNITINGEDSYGDGWTGWSIGDSYLNIVQNGTTVYGFTLTTGYSDSYSTALTADSPITFEWVSGDYDDEASFTITVDGVEVANVTDGSTLTDGQVVYTIAAGTPTMTAVIPEGTTPVDPHTNLTFTATPDAGYEFVNWTDVDGNIVSSTNPTIVEIVSDTTLVANFSTEVYTVYAYSTDTVKGTVSPATANLTVEQGALLTATPKYGYVFVNWTDKTGAVLSTTAAFTLTDVTIDTVYANFNYDYFDVTVAANDNTWGSVTLNNSTTLTGNFPYGDTVTLRATAAEGYYFVNWTNNAGSVVSDQLMCTFIVEADETYTANFADGSTYTVTAVPDTNVHGSVTGAGDYMAGQVATLTAVAFPNYFFTEWNDGNTDNPRAVTVTANADFVAIFDTVAYNVTVNGVTEAVKYGRNYTVIAADSACRTFNGWSNGTDVVASGNQYTFVVTGDITLTATYSEPVTVTEEVTMATCGAYTWNGVERTTTGDYTYTTTTAAGCDSTITLHLTVSDVLTSTDVQTSCGAYTWIDGNTYTESNNTATYTTTASNGCDSVITLNLTVNNPAGVSTTATECGSYTWNGTAYTTSGTYNYSYTDNNGCTVVDTLVLTINQPTSEIVSASACGSYTWSGETYTTSGIYYDTLTNAAGCDSIVTLALTINQPVYTTINQTACDSYTWNNETLTVSGNYYDTLTAANSCDSIITLNLTINQGATATVTETACDSYNWNGETYTTSGTYTWNGTASNGCDSTVTLTLTVNQSVSETVTETVENNIVWNGETYTASGNYTWTGVAANGCDSTVTLVLTVTGTVAPDTNYYTVTIETANGGMGVLTGAGTYAEGTVVTLTATPNEGFEFIAWMVGNDTVCITPEYTFTLVSDTTVTAVFEALPVYYTVTGVANDDAMGYVLGSNQYAAGSEATLTAQANAGYHFVRWSNGHAEPTITFTVTGDITLTAIFEADQPVAGIDESDMENVTIYSAESTIFVRGAEGKDVRVYDINGRTISSQMNAGETVEFRMTATGVYLVKVGNAPAKRVLVVR